MRYPLPMTTYFTADTHFGHARIIELANRPFNTVEEMNEVLVTRINETVGPEDRLVILGDIVMGKLDDNLPLLSRINAGELVLVPGNHDRWSLAYEHRGDADAKREAFRLRYEATRPNTVAILDNPVSAWKGLYTLTNWDEETALDNVLFSHYPYDGDSHGEDRHGSLRAADEGLPIIHGHVHEEWKINGRQYNVGVDVNDFKPVSEWELVAWVESL